MKKSQIIMGILIIVAAGISFFAGMNYKSSQNQGNAASLNRGGGGQSGQRNGTGNRTGNRATAGDIINIDDKSITVKLQDGSSKIVLISDKTQLNKADAATKEDLKTGIRVLVFGSDNTDGSVTAQNIQINPQLGGMGDRFGGQRPSPTGAK